MVLVQLEDLAGYLCGEGNSEIGFCGAGSSEIGKEQWL